MQTVGQTWLNLVIWTCGSWSEGQHDLYFTVQWFCLISWRLFDVCTSYFWSMNQYDLKCRSLWPIFHGPVIVPYTLTISWMNIISDYESVWPDAWPENKLGHCDLYFMVQWFCYILKTIWCMNIILGDYGSVWPDVWPQNKEMAPARGIRAPLGTCSSVNQNWSKHPWRLRRVLLVAAPPYTHIYGVRPRTAWPGVVLKWLSTQRCSTISVYTFTERLLNTL